MTKLISVTLLLIAIFVNTNAQVKVQYAFTGQGEQTEVLFVDFYTNDTLYKSNQKTGNFQCDKWTLLKLTINNKLNLAKQIMVETKPVIFDIKPDVHTGYYQLIFKNNGINLKYHTFQNELIELRASIDSISRCFYDTTYPKAKLTEARESLAQLRHSIQEKSAMFFLQNDCSYISLNYINDQMPPDSVTRLTLLHLLNNLRGHVTTDKFYAKLRVQLLDTIRYLAQRDMVPNLKLQDRNNGVVPLHTLLAEQGDTYVVFWASWCYGCHKLFDKINALSASEPTMAKSKFVFVSFDQDKTSWLRELDKTALLNNSFNMKEGFDNIDIYRLGFNFLPYVIKIKPSGLIDTMDVKLF
jgi:thiol-disulfide isomerase/thioredoxin